MGVTRGTKSSGNSSSSSSSSSSAGISIARISHLRAALFNPKVPKRACALTRLPVEVLQCTGAYLEDKDQSLVKLAHASKSTYQALYPVIKTGLVKVLKKWVEQDNTVQVRKLLACHPYLQLRKDLGDPTGRAYNGIETTPYQDALADPMAEEMRAVLEAGFPGETEEERLSCAALQAQEFKSPRFDRFREEKQNWMGLTRFAYDVWNRRYQAWQATGFTNVHIQPLRDAWARVGLAQEKWPKRLKKIFSSVNMDEKQTFENLPFDLPEPHFGGDENALWHLDRIGCSFRLLVVPAERDLGAADFQAELGRVSEGNPVLIQCGADETATYHLWAPHIFLEQDESEWRCVLIGDARIHQLVRFGYPTTDPAVVGSVDFTQEELPYSPLFEDLYQFARAHDLYVGSGFSFFFAVANHARERYLGTWGQGTALRAGLVGPRAVQGRSNFAAVDRVFTKRTERLAKYLADLEFYLPHETPKLLR